jgi:hypothetical protein
MKSGRDAFVRAEQAIPEPPIAGEVERCWGRPTS